MLEETNFYSRFSFVPANIIENPATFLTFTPLPHIYLLILKIHQPTLLLHAKSRTRETLHLSTSADSSTHTTKKTTIFFLILRHASRAEFLKARDAGTHIQKKFLSAKFCLLNAKLQKVLVICHVSHIQCQFLHVPF